MTGWPGWLPIWAAVFTVFGLQQKSLLDQIGASGRTDYSRTQVAGFANTGTMDFTVALVSGAVAGALAATTAYLWAAN